MRVVVAGNMGYIGPAVVRELRSRHPDATLIGLDTGFFAHCLTTPGPLPELLLDQQIFADVRTIDADSFPRCDAVIELAALSNDVLGTTHEEATLAINHRAAVRLAEMAKRAGARAFIFASSCSVYGAAGDFPRNEQSETQPLTPYARSKVLAEDDLAALATESFLVTSLRFGTACGMSERLRLDLVLNDFVASALAGGTIEVASDGTPWRPLIDVRDMARAIAWALAREGDPFVVVNAGSERCSVRVRDLAGIVASRIDGTRIRFAADPPADRRSYRVDFARFRALAPDHQPCFSIEDSVDSLAAGLRAIGFADANFRQSQYMRLETLRHFRAAGRLRDNLTWV